MAAAGDKDEFMGRCVRAPGCSVLVSSWGMRACPLMLFAGGCALVFALTGCGAPPAGATSAGVQASAERLGAGAQARVESAGAARRAPDCSVRERAERVGQSFTPWGARRLWCDPATRPGDAGTPLSIEGFVVATNLARMPSCAVHPAGVADPADCRSEIPTFWVGDSVETPLVQAIPVMGWASNAAQLFDAIADFDSSSPSAEVVDELWGRAIPNPLPAPGAKVRVDGSYGTRFSLSSAGGLQNAAVGVLTYRAMRTLSPAPSLATLPGVVRRPDALSGSATRTSLAAAAPTTPATQPAPRLLAVKALRGPLVSLSDYCTDPNDTCLLTADEVESRLGQGAAMALAGRGRFLAVKLIGKASGPYASYELAIRTTAGWFVHDLELITNDAVSGAWTGSAAVEALSYQPLVSGASTVVLLVIEGAGAAGGSLPPEDYYESTWRSLALCTLGTGGVPACSKLLSLEAWSTDAQGTTTGYELGYELPGDGTLRISHRAGTLDAEVQGLIGVHRVALP